MCKEKCKFGFYVCFVAEPLAWAGPAENRNGMPEAKKRKYDFDCL